MTWKIEYKNKQSKVVSELPIQIPTSRTRANLIEVTVQTLDNDLLLRYNRIHGIMKGCHQRVVHAGTNVDINTHREVIEAGRTESLNFLGVIWNDG